MKNQKVLYGLSALAIILVIVGFVLYSKGNNGLIQGSINTKLSTSKVAANKGAANTSGCSVTISQSDLDLSAAGGSAYVIKKAGTYCLGSDLNLKRAGMSQTNGPIYAINIQANSVILDLKKYEIDGFDATASITAVQTDNYNNITVKNGKIRNFVYAVLANYTDGLYVSDVETNEVLQPITSADSKNVRIANNRVIKSGSFTENHPIGIAIYGHNSSNIYVSNNYAKNYSEGISVFFAPGFNGTITGSVDNNKTCNAARSTINPAITTSNNTSLTGNC